MTIRIHAPEIRVHADDLELSARVESHALPPGVPDRMTFSIARSSGLKFSDRSDAFLAGMLPIAMRLRQRIKIDGEVSTRLAHGLENYQDVLCAWWPDIFRRVEISAAKFDLREKDARPDGVGSSFSGGVDSFSAVMELRPQVSRYPEFSITHALMINGFGNFNDLNRSGVSGQMQRFYANALKQWGVPLVMVHSNLRPFRRAVFSSREVAYSYSASLASCAHALSPVFGRFNIPGWATNRYEDLAPEGSHPILDHHLSSDQLQVLHFGTSLSRSEKIERLATEAPVRQSLFACFRPPVFAADSGRVKNCGRCEKCLRTITILDIIGQLGAVQTFSHIGDIRAYKDPKVLMHISTSFLRDSIRAAQRHHRNDWLRLLTTALKERTAHLSAGSKAAR